MTDDAEHYYLRDSMGGAVGMFVDHDGDSGTARVTKFQVFDSFGNRVTDTLNEAGTYAWRGAEGSETDFRVVNVRAAYGEMDLADGGLVLMQARHYDPTLGRFVQADALLMASGTTQGMNRYIYCENDPVNRTDPSGLSIGTLQQKLTFLKLGIIVAIFTLLVIPPIAWLIVLGTIILLTAEIAKTEGDIYALQGRCDLARKKYAAAVNRYKLGLAILAVGAGILVRNPTLVKQGAGGVVALLQEAGGIIGGITGYFDARNSLEEI